MTIGCVFSGGKYSISSFVRNSLPQVLNFLEFCETLWVKEILYVIFLIKTYLKMCKIVPCNPLWAAVQWHPHVEGLRTPSVKPSLSGAEP